MSAVWVIEVAATDSDGYNVAADALVVTVTLPDGTDVAPAVTTPWTGRYRAEYLLAVPGRHVAVAVDPALGATDFAAYATGVTTQAGMPTTDDIADYLREDAASWGVGDLAGALAAEAAAQRAMCRVGAQYPDDLREALLRRVARNLAMRSLPLAAPAGDAEVPRFLPRRDPEVGRLEAPYRRMTVG